MVSTLEVTQAEIKCNLKCLKVEAILPFLSLFIKTGSILTSYCTKYCETEKGQWQQNKNNKIQYPKENVLKKSSWWYIYFFFFFFLVCFRITYDKKHIKNSTDIETHNLPSNLKYRLLLKLKLEILLQKK